MYKMIKSNHSRITAVIILLTILFCIIIDFQTNAQIPCHASTKCCSAMNILSKDKDFNNFVGHWAIENQNNKSAYNCATDKCVMAYSQALLKHETPTSSCSCNSTWVDVEALNAQCNKAGGVICPSNEYLTDETKTLSVRNLFLNCIPNECNNPSDIKSLESEATQNPLCKDIQRCQINFNCPS